MDKSDWIPCEPHKFGAYPKVIPRRVGRQFRIKSGGTILIGDVNEADSDCACCENLGSMIVDDYRDLL